MVSLLLKNWTPLDILRQVCKGMDLYKYRTVRIWSYKRMGLQVMALRKDRVALI